MNRKNQGGLPKTLYVLQSATIQDLSLSHETGSNSQNSPSQKRELLDINFIFLAGPIFPLAATPPDSPAMTAVVIFPVAIGNTTLPLQIRGQHWLTSPLWEVMAGPSLALGVRCHPPALGPSSSKKKSSFVLKPQS